MRRLIFFLVWVTVPPAENQANEEVVKLVAKRLETARRNVSILKGGHSRLKVVEVVGVSEEAGLLLLRNNQ